MKRTLGQRVGTTFGPIIDWALKHWFKLSVVILIAYAVYSLHVFVEDFETFGVGVLTYMGSLLEWIAKRGTLT